MRKHSREFIGFLGIFLSLFSFVMSFALAQGADVPAPQKLFESKCSQCHGKDAKGAVKMAKVLKVDPAAVDLTKDSVAQQSAADMGKTVTNGKKKMPKFKGKLTDKQIQDVVGYVKSLQGAGAEKEGKGK